MKTRDMARAPLKDVQNVQQDARPLSGKPADSAAPTKFKVAATTTIRKGPTSKAPNPVSAARGISARSTSNLPLPPAMTRRRTIAAARPENATAAAAASQGKPARLGAKRKPTVLAPSAQRALTAEDRRRSAAPMAFTHGSTAARSGLSGGAAAPAAPSTSSETAFVQTFAKEALGTMADLVKQSQTSQAALSGAVMKDMEATLSAKVSELVAERVSATAVPQGDRDQILLKLAEEKAAFEYQLRELQRQFEEEKLAAEGLRAELEEAKQTIAQSEASSAGVNSAKHAELLGQVESLKKLLLKAQSGLSDIGREKTALETSLSEKVARISALECEVEAANAKAKENRRRFDAAEAENSATQDEVRRLKRERESERDEAESALKRKTQALSESQEKVHHLEAKVNGLMVANDTARRKADMQLETLRGDMLPKMRSLEAERDELVRTKETMASEARQRDAEIASRDSQLTHMKESLAVQESKLSQLGCEAMAQNVKIESLHSETARLQAELNRALHDMAEQRREMDNLERQARQDAAVRRRLHNTIQELKGNIRVFCRVRPPLAREVEGPGGAAARELFDFKESGQDIVARPPGDRKSGGGGAGSQQQHPFKFDKVFDPSSSQATVFEEISELVQSALDGYRVCIFAYGQTGSGKTHTMLGQGGNGDAQLGMIPRAVRQIFDSARGLAKDGWTFQLNASFLEIYNESIRDLLNSNGGGGSSSDNLGKAKDGYKITFDQQKRLSTVSELTVVRVENEGEVQRLIERSMRNRATAATKANERSSRSHSVFRLFITGKNAGTGQVLNGLLNLIDLAGSERLTQSKAEGERLRETRHINRSLSALGDVIQSLANNEKHVPFRNSKLTHLLQDSLGGDSKTLMFVNVSHAVESFHESLCSLRFAAKVNSCHVGTARRSAKVDLSSG